MSGNLSCYFDVLYLNPGDICICITLTIYENDSQRSVLSKCVKIFGVCCQTLLTTKHEIVFEFRPDDGVALSLILTNLQYLSNVYVVSIRTKLNNSKAVTFCYRKWLLVVFEDDL